MIKHDKRLTRISQEEFLQTIRDNANTMAVLTGLNPTGRLDSEALVSVLFDEVDKHKVSRGPWMIDDDGFFVFEKPLSGRHRIRIEEDLKKVRRYYFKNEEHHLLIRIARNEVGDAACDNYSLEMVSVLKYLFEE